MASQPPPPTTSAQLVGGAASMLPTRTVVAAAPAQDPITQAQIVLNNLLDQVRENFHFLLEGAPALTLSGEVAQPPVRTLARCRQDRIEFEKSWRKAAAKRMSSSSALQQTSDSGPKGDELDNEAEEQLVTPGGVAEKLNLVTEAANEPDTNALADIQRDPLFRAQRMAAITQALRALIPQLPSTVYNDPVTGEQKYIDDPHTSSEYEKQLKYWDEMNGKINVVFEAHLNSFEKILTELNENQSYIVSKILNHSD